MRMMKPTTYAVAGALVILSALGSPVHGDTYRRGEMAFEIDGMSVEEVQKTVISSMTYFGSKISGDDPVTLHWPAGPCFKADTADEAHRDMVRSSVETITQRLNLKIPACAGAEATSIAYYFAEGKLSPGDLKAAQDFIDKPSEMFSSFLDGSLPCYWRFKIDDFKKSEIGRAIVLANTVDLDDEGIRRCVFLGTLGTLGLIQPSGLNEEPGIFEESSDAWNRHVELNLLALFALSVVLEESAHDSQQIYAGQFATKLRHVIWTMHELGK
jgi:hypothetical protein